MADNKAFLFNVNTLLKKKSYIYSYKQDNHQSPPGAII